VTIKVELGAEDLIRTSYENLARCASKAVMLLLEQECAEVRFAITTIQREPVGYVYATKED
jgi:hypothetical protein